MGGELVAVSSCILLIFLICGFFTDRKELLVAVHLHGADLWLLHVIKFLSCITYEQAVK